MPGTGHATRGSGSPARRQHSDRHTSRYQMFGIRFRIAQKRRPDGVSRYVPVLYVLCVGWGRGGGREVGFATFLGGQIWNTLAPKIIPSGTALVVTPSPPSLCERAENLF